MSFELFDPGREVSISEGSSLPHWYQSGVTYFITFRTEDSFPREVADRWRRARIDWLARRGVAIDQFETEFPKLSRFEQSSYHETFSREYLEVLDKGLGECVLRRSDLAKICSESFQYFNELRYRLSDFIVMPNHVHLLVCLLGETEIQSQCYSWKKFAATKINRVLGRSGRFWQEESFDHLIRSVEQFEAVRRYIQDNGRNAGLDASDYLVYQRQEL